MKDLHRKPRRSKGAALITALLVVALATVAAAGMAHRQRVDIHRAENILSADQAYLYAQGVESWALGVLNYDGLESNVDHLSEAWAIGIPVEKVDNGTVQGALHDLQARFNLNNLVSDGKPNEIELQRLKRLLIALQLAPEVADNIMDWLDSDQDPGFPNGAEDDYYSGLAEPYRTANRPIRHISELRLIKGITDESFRKLAPYVSALLQRTKININTAPREVLMSIANGISINDAESLIASRNSTPFTDAKSLLQHDAFAGVELSPSEITLGSQYFLVQSHTRFGRANLQMSAVIQRLTGTFPKVTQRFKGNYAGSR